VELICLIKNHATERRDHTLLGDADRIDALLRILVMNKLLRQRTVDRLMELVRCIKDEATETADDELSGMANQADALVGRLLAELNMEARADTRYSRGRVAS
jgi:hypothetical protein